MESSRVLRAVVQMEVFAIVPPTVEGVLPGTLPDLEGIVREGIQANAGDGNVWTVAGEGEATEWEELTA